VINVRKIVYATDFSSYSNQAYFHAVALAEGHGASLTVVHVYTREADGVLSGPAAEKERAYWRGQLEQIRPLDPHISVQHVLLEGDPAQEIIGLATESAADLIVMGTHGRTGLERFLMGSVAEKVLYGAPCSVLVVKMPKAAPFMERPETAGALSPA
jgi:nucleotide-binding universal stress UspA family protein